MYPPNFKNSGYKYKYLILLSIFNHKLTKAIKNATSRVAYSYSKIKKPQATAVTAPIAENRLATVSLGMPRVMNTMRVE